MAIYLFITAYGNRRTRPRTRSSPDSQSFISCTRPEGSIQIHARYNAVKLLVSPIPSNQ